MRRELGAGGVRAGAARAASGQLDFDGAMRARRFIRRDLRLAAWFLWMMPLAAALSMRFTAVRMAAALSSAPASVAPTAVLTRVLISERAALLRRRRRSF